MGRIEKTVFISYRRTNVPWALAVYQNLTANGYDAFFDFNSIASGDFEQVILGNIKARAHFIVILTPSALERCAEPGDWLRREIETALEYRRNIVPLMLEGFDYSTPSITQHMTGNLSLLKNYNALRVPVEYFAEAMARLRDKFLNVPLDAVLHPIPDSVQRAVKTQQAAANSADQVAEEELTAQQWFERGNALWKTNRFNDAIHCYSEAIQIKPDFVAAYNNRAVLRQTNGDLEGAIVDFSTAIKYEPDYTLARMSLIGILRGLGRTAESQEHEQITRSLINKEMEYNRACFEAICGNSDKALQLLKIGLAKGQTSKEWARRDPDLKNLRDDPRFKALVE